MALSNYEKQKRWREKNRALYNFQQRQRRKKGGDATCQPDKRETRQVGSNAAPTVRSAGAAGFETKKVGEFRMLVLSENPEERSTMPVVKPQVYRNDYGAVITEAQYNALQEKKKIAEQKGYVLDEYSQT